VDHEPQGRLHDGDAGKDYLVLPVADQLVERYGDALATVAYMNTGGRLKALAGRTGGAACTSSNAHLVVDWARKRGKKVFFVPDEHLGRNTAHKLGISPERVVALPDPRRGQIALADVGLARLDRAEMILWGSSCGVHTIFTLAMVRYWQERDYRVLVHPEAPLETVLAADGSGSTNYLWNEFERAPRGAKLAIGTEGHFVRNAQAESKARGVEVVHLPRSPAARWAAAAARR